MATRLTHEQMFAGDPATVMAMFRDPAYVELKCQRTGSRETTVVVVETLDGGCVITSTRVLPARVPAVAAPFVGETLTVTEIQTWGMLDADGMALATATVDFGAPMTFSGRITLSPSANGSLVITEGQFKASVPFVGGKIEQGGVEQTRRYLDVEEGVGNEWLSR